MPVGIRSYHADAWKMSFGRYLKAIRERQGISLEDVADEICVSPKQLSWIEAEDHERMPTAVYTKGILRSYAKAVGVDPDDIVERYQINLSAYEQAIRAEAEILTSGKKTLPRMLIALCALAAIIVVSIYAFSLIHPPPGTVGRNEMETGDRGAEIPLNRSDNTGQSYNGGSQPPKPSATAPLSAAVNQLLIIDAVSEVTLNVQIDGQSYTKYHLHPNDHVELEAESYFNILISDAAGVRLRLNGEPVELHGEPGHSVNVLLPKDSGDR